MVRLCLLLAAILLALPVVKAQNEEPSAILGNMARGTGNASSAAAELALQQAMERARDSGFSTATPEHLLLALMDDPSVLQMLGEQYIDPDAIRTSLRYHLESTDMETQSSDRPPVDSALRRVAQRAFSNARLTNRDELETTDLVVAILAEGNSDAARILSERGLTVDQAEKAAIAAYVERTSEQSRKLDDMRLRIAEQNARQAQSGANMEIRSGTVSGRGLVTGPRRYTLRVTSADDDRETEFKAAVSRDGRLDLYIESTPFETEFLATRIAALFEAIDNRHLKVELMTDIEGQRMTISSFGGTAGAIFEDPREFSQQRSGTL